LGLSTTGAPTSTVPYRACASSSHYYPTMNHVGGIADGVPRGVDLWCTLSADADIPRIIDSLVDCLDSGNLHYGLVRSSSYAAAAACPEWRSSCYYHSACSFSAIGGPILPRTVAIRDLSSSSVTTISASSRLRGSVRFSLCYQFHNERPLLIGRHLIAPCGRQPL